MAKGKKKNPSGGNPYRPVHPDAKNSKTQPPPSTASTANKNGSTKRQRLRQEANSAVSPPQQYDIAVAEDDTPMARNNFSRATAFDGRRGDGRPRGNYGGRGGESQGTGTVCRFHG